MSYTQTHRGNASLMPAVSSTHTRVSSGPAIPGSAYYTNDGQPPRQVNGSWSATTLAAAQRRRQMTPVSMRAPVRQGETPIDHPPIGGRSFSSPAVVSAATVTASSSIPNRYHRASRVAGLQPPPTVTQFGSNSPSLDGESTSTVTSRSSASSCTSTERSPMLVGKEALNSKQQAVPFTLRGHKHKLSIVNVQNEQRAKRASTIAPQGRRTSAGSIASQSSDNAPQHTLVLPSDEKRIRRASMPQLTSAYSSNSVQTSSSTITPSVSANQLDSIYHKEVAAIKAPRQRPVYIQIGQPNTAPVTPVTPSFSLSPVGKGQESVVTSPISETKDRSDNGATSSLSTLNAGTESVFDPAAIAARAAEKQTRTPSPSESPKTPPRSSALQMPMIPRAKQNMTTTIVTPSSSANTGQIAPQIDVRDHYYANAHDAVPVYETLKEDSPTKKVSFKQKLKNMVSKKHKSRSKDSDAISVKSGTSLMSGFSVFSGRSISSTFSFRSFRMFNKNRDEPEDLPPVMHNFDIEQPPLVPIISRASPTNSERQPSPPTSTLCNKSVESMGSPVASDNVVDAADNVMEDETVGLELAPVASDSSENLDAPLSPSGKPGDLSDAAPEFTFDEEAIDLDHRIDESVDLSSGGTVFPGSLDEKDVATIRNALERVSSLDRKPSRRNSRSSRAAIPSISHDTSTDSFEQTLEQLDSFVNLSLSSIPAFNDTEPRAVRFVNQIRVYETHSCAAYDRRPEPATCNRLTPALAQQIKCELNALKLTMDVHHESRDNTHFF